MADTPVLEAGAERCVGSSPTVPTIANRFFANTASDYGRSSFIYVYVNSVVATLSSLSYQKIRLLWRCGQVSEILPNCLSDIRSA